MKLTIREKSSLSISDFLNNKSQTIVRHVRNPDVVYDQEWLEMCACFLFKVDRKHYDYVNHYNWHSHIPTKVREEYKAKAQEYLKMIIDAGFDLHYDIPIKD